MNAVIYTRVSQDHGTRSVQEQERECREWCARQGWSVTRVLTDNDIGASRYSGKDRPAYRELKKSLEPGDVLVTWEASRAQRDLAAYVELRDLCAALGVRWAYTGRVYDLTDGDDRFSTGLDALLAEKEAEQIRARVLRGKRSAALEGRPHSFPPFGYQQVRDPGSGRTVGWEPSADAPLIQEAARRVLQGSSLREVTRWLVEQGAPFGSQRTLRQRLMQPSYAGLRTFHGEVVGEGRWPGLWSVEQHQQLVALLTDPARRNSGAGLPVKHLLAGIAKCGVCGRGLRHYWPPAAQKRNAPPAYVCPAPSLHVRRRQEPLEALVVEAVKARLRRADRSLLGDGGEVAAEAWEEARALRARLDGFTESAAEGDLTPRALAAIERKLLPQIAAAEAKAQASYRSPLIGRLVESPDDWDDLTLVEQREVIRSLVSVTVNKTMARGAGQFRPEDIDLTPL